MNLFKSTPEAPNDPILGVVEKYNQDNRESKINLSIGVYTNEQGKVPVLAAVQEAQAQLASNHSPRNYLPMDGLKSYCQGVQDLLLGKNHPLIQNDQVATLQTLGGTGALKIGADFLSRFEKNSKVYVSNPTWGNHRAIFKGAGFEVLDYPYFDEKTGGVAFDELCEFFKNLAPKSILILHACCHNPTGADLTVDQWKTIAEIIEERNLIPFLDMAYQGFSNGITEDALPVQIMLDRGLNVFIATSFSKSFSLYGERTGALSVVTNQHQEKVAVLSQLKQMVRANYSSPPLYGAEIVSTILNSDQLRKDWENELAQMKNRIKTMRNQLVTELNEGQNQRDFSFINQQAGMFSYTGLSAEQAERMKNEFAVYIVDSGRICIAALNSNNIKATANAIINVL